MKIDIDIIDKIFADFKGEEILKVYSALRSRIGSGYHLMNDQYPRSVLYLARGSMTKFTEILLIDDPRDVIHEAEIESGETGHWFSISFDKIKELDGKKYEMPVTKYENDDLPF